MSYTRCNSLSNSPAPDNAYARASGRYDDATSSLFQSDKADVLAESFTQSSSARVVPVAPISAVHISQSIAFDPLREQFLSDHDVAARYSVKKQTIWRRKNEVADFPNPIKIRGTTRWRLSDVVAYEQTIAFSAKKR
jgi:predicted DNA-binding transcriptional regulator AlpA